MKKNYSVQAFKKLFAAKQTIICILLHKKSIKEERTISYPSSLHISTKESNKSHDSPPYTCYRWGQNSSEKYILLFE